MVLENEVSGSNGELNDNSTSSIDSPELIAALKRLPTKVALLEHHNERLQNEHKAELEKMTSSFETALALKNDKIKKLEDENAMLRELANGRNPDSENNNEKVEEGMEEDDNDEASFDECLQLAMEHLRTEHKKELEQMSSTFKTALALKNRKVKDLEEEVEQLREVMEFGICDEKQNDCQSAHDEEEEMSDSKDEEIKSPVSILCKGWSVGEKMVAYVKPSDFVIRAKFTEVSKKQQYFFTFVFSESDNEHEFAVLLRKIKDYIDLSIIERTRKGVAFPRSFAHVDLISQKSDEFDFITQVKKSHVRNGNYISLQPQLISCKDLFDKEKGYVKDDSIIIDFIVKASPSQ